MTFELGTAVQCDACEDTKFGDVVESPNPGMTKIVMADGRFWESASQTFRLAQKNEPSINKTTEDLYRLCMS